jgi:hypothetical protein
MRIVIVIVALLIALPAAAQVHPGCPVGAGMFDSYESAGCSIKRVGGCTVHHDKVLGFRATTCLPKLPRATRATHRRWFHEPHGRWAYPAHRARPPRERVIERESLKYERVIKKEVR